MQQSLTVVLFSYTMFLISNRLLCHAAINRAKEVKKDLFPDDSAQDGTAPTSAPSENTVPLLSVVKFFRMKAGASCFLFIFVALLEAMSWLCLFFALGLLVYQTYHPLQPMSLGLVAVGPLGWGMFSGLATAMASWHLLHAENMQLATLAIRTTKDSA